MASTRSIGQHSAAEPLMTPRQKWKRLFRRYRIERRELAKAQRDMMLFGMGWYEVSGDGLPEHVPFEQVVI